MIMADHPTWMQTYRQTKLCILDGNWTMYFIKMYLTWWMTFFLDYQDILRIAAIFGQHCLPNKIEWWWFLKNNFTGKFTRSDIDNNNVIVINNSNNWCPMLQVLYNLRPQVISARDLEGTTYTTKHAARAVRAYPSAWQQLMQWTLRIGIALTALVFARRLTNRSLWTSWWRHMDL